MVEFRYIQEVEEWLEPFDYIAFWEAVAPYNLDLPDRDNCDGLIVGGKADTALVLSGLKFLAVMDLQARLGLKHRITEPVVAKYLMSVH